MVSFKLSRHPSSVVRSVQGCGANNNIRARFDLRSLTTNHSRKQIALVALCPHIRQPFLQASQQAALYIRTHCNFGLVL